MKKNLKRILSLVLAFAMALGCVGLASAAGSTDTDYANHWAQSYIQTMVDEGYILGYPDGTYRPNSNITRAEFVSIINRMMGYSAQDIQDGWNTFTDMTRQSAWYYDEIAIAVSMGILNGYEDSTIRPNGEITRQEACAILYRVIFGEDYDYQYDAQTLAGFDDTSSVSRWAVKYVAAMVEIGAIEGFTDNTIRGKDNLTRAQAATVLVKLMDEMIPQVVVSASAESTIFGSADTGNKSTLKAELVKTSGPGDTYLYYYNEDGERVTYEDQTLTYEADTLTYTGEAVITLSLSQGEIDDSKIDSSNAVVCLIENDGYYVDELVLNADSLTGTWENGQLVYTLSEGDLEWYTGDYEWSDYNSGREWSCFGGDGNGYYTFYFQVSGITYDGQEVDPVTFVVNVYIWGRDGSDRVSSFDATVSPVAVESTSGAEQTDEIQWIWVGDDSTGDPILCDNLTDDFFIVWPEGTDASSLTAENVTVTLYNNYGASYTLETENAYDEQQYAVFSSQGETQVAVTFMHWAYVPVFTTMTITVDDGNGLTAEMTYDVDSVYIYMVQQGGGGVTVDGTVTTYSYYGFENLEDVWQIMTKATYTLYTTIDDTKYYYAEDGSLTTDSSAAASFDASGEEDRNQQLIVNTAWITTRQDQTVEMEIDGQTLVFTKSYSGGSTVSASVAAANGLVAADGYVLGSSITPYEMWAWQARFLAGYTTSDAEPTGSPYVSFPYGY